MCRARRGFPNNEWRGAAAAVPANYSRPAPAQGHRAFLAFLARHSGDRSPTQQAFTTSEALTPASAVRKQGIKQLPDISMVYEKNIGVPDFLTIQLLFNKNPPS